LDVRRWSGHLCCSEAKVLEVREERLDEVESFIAATSRGERHAEHRRFPTWPTDAKVKVDLRTGRRGLDAHREA
jgi:hypothetical protein